MTPTLFAETVRQALKNIASNKFRTLLTMLGIIIGITAVIVIVGLGNGMTQSMRDSFASMGTNTLTVSVPGFGSRTVDVDEMYDLAEENSSLFENVSPVVTLAGTVKVGSSTLEEACAAALSLLGYDVTTLSGTFPDAQLNKARELGLREGLSAGQGDTLTIAQGAQLLYNALTAVTAEGETYGTTLGLAVTDGQRGHRPRHQRLRHRSPGRNCGPDGEGRHHHHLHHLLFLRRRERGELPERH